VALPKPAEPSKSRTLEPFSGESYSTSSLKNDSVAPGGLSLNGGERGSRNIPYARTTVNLPVHRNCCCTFHEKEKKCLKIEKYHAETL